MNIALLGYGKMGKRIEALAVVQGHTISHKITSQNPQDIYDLSHTDVAIDFSKPTLAVQHAKACFSQKIPCVMGTTGWLEGLDDLKKNCQQHNASFVYASNFSIGVNIFFAANRYLAKLMDGYPQYHVHIREEHHTEKLDSPSGTALSTASDLLKHLGRKTEWVENAKEPQTHQLNIFSQRKANVIGNHLVTYTSNEDEIILSHSAKNRDGFALGALYAAQWIQDKKGFFSVQDIFKF